LFSLSEDSAVLVFLFPGSVEKWSRHSSEWGLGLLQEQADTCGGRKRISLNMDGFFII
jgi:hypothetical protein